MSSTWIALLRGMNVGGHRITNADLANAFTALGFGNVGTYRASGNVLFDADEGDPASVTRTIEAGLEAALGYAVPTFLRDPAALHAVCAARPFSDDVLEASTGKPQVTFLADRPDTAAREAVLALATDDDRLAFDGRELYWLPAKGVGRSELDHAAIARILGHGTTRTLGTVAGIAKKLAAR